MNLHQIQYYIEVCNCRSISMAAKKLFMEKATISRSISELEHELGVTCLERSPKGVSLTQYGEIVYKAFTSAQSTILSMVSDLEELKRKETTYVDILIAYGVMKSLSTKMWNTYLHKYEGVKKLVPLDLPDRQVEKGILEKNASLGFTVGPVDTARFDADLLKREPVYLMISEKNPLYPQETIEISSQLGIRFFGYSPDFKLQELFTQFCRGYGFDPKPHYVSEDIHSLIQMSIENRGLFFVPECWCEFSRADVRYVKLPVEEISWDVYMIKRKNEVLPAALEEFRRFCLDYCRNIFPDTVL